MSDISTNIKEQIESKLQDLINDSKEEIKALLTPKIPILAEIGAALLNDVQEKRDISRNLAHVDSLFANMTSLGRIRAKILFSDAIEAFIEMTGVILKKALLSGV